MSEHHGSSSPEETSSEHDSASVTSFDDGELVYPHLKKSSLLPLQPAHDASPIFPFSLLSACSAQGRAVTMCQFARSMTSADTASSAKLTIGLRGECILQSGVCQRYCT